MMPTCSGRFTRSRFNWGIARASTPVAMFCTKIEIEIGAASWNAISQMMMASRAISWKSAVSGIAPPTGIAA